MSNKTWNISRSKCDRIAAIGAEGQAGTYILRIYLKREKIIQFGRFNNGKPVEMPKGNYVYIGSALSQRGSTTLGNRISRHAARSIPKPPHNIRSIFREFCDDIGLYYTETPSDKTPFWNIDHLTNIIDSEITGIVFIRSSEYLENEWSEFIEERDDTEIIMKGLGANDAEGHSHLQISYINDNDWKRLPEILPKP